LPGTLAEVAANVVPALKLARQQQATALRMTPSVMNDVVNR
jgi:hypothetical protein